MAVSGAQRLTVGCAVRFVDDDVYGGDAAFVRCTDGVWLLCIVDVLGHGATADRARTRILEALGGLRVDDVVSTLQTLDECMRRDIGAVAGVCRIDEASQSAEYAGIGNTSIRRLGVSASSPHSQDGVLGQRSHRPRPVAFPLGTDEIIVMHTDGIPARAPLSRYHPVFAGSAEDAAQTLLERFAKANDDAACIVAKWAA